MLPAFRMYTGKLHLTVMSYFHPLSQKPVYWFSLVREFKALASNEAAKLSVQGAVSLSHVSGHYLFYNRH